MSVMSDVSTPEEHFGDAHSLAFQKYFSLSLIMAEISLCVSLPHEAKASLKQHSQVPQAGQTLSLSTAALKFLRQLSCLLCNSTEEHGPLGSSFPEVDPDEQSSSFDP